MTVQMILRLTCRDRLEWHGDDIAIDDRRPEPPECTYATSTVDAASTSTAVARFDTRDGLHPAARTEVPMPIQ